MGPFLALVFPEAVRPYLRVYLGPWDFAAFAHRSTHEFRVEIYAANGTLLEAGTAEQPTNGIDWTYTATQANNPLAGSKIKAIATDVPGNEGALEVTL